MDRLNIASSIMNTVVETMDHSYGIVYTITNKNNGRIYVGATTLPLEIRWKQHLRSKNSKKSRFYRHLRGEGVEAFEIQQIASCLDVRDLAALETEIMSQIPSNNLYNRILITEDVWSKTHYG